MSAAAEAMPWATSSRARALHAVPRCGEPGRTVPGQHGGGASWHPGPAAPAGAGAGTAAADGGAVAARRASSIKGARGHLAGQAAEDAVEAHYLRAGRDVLARRWRGRGGEVDLVARDGEELVFVEVKASRSFARAAERVTPRQITRLFAAAAEFLSDQPLGQATPVRFDVALVDGLGRIEVLENALCA